MIASARAMRGSALIAFIVVIADQLTKQWALSALRDGDIDVFWTLRFHLTFNSGMAFSRGQGLGPVIGVIALVVVVVLLLSLRRGGSRLNDVAVGLIVGGAIGNVLDRLFREQGWFRGRVVDFIDFQWFPVFNVADMGVTVGGALLLLASVMVAQVDPAAPAPGAGPDGDVA